MASRAAIEQLGSHKKNIVGKVGETGPKYEGVWMIAAPTGKLCAA